MVKTKNIMMSFSGIHWALKIFQSIFQFLSRVLLSSCTCSIYFSVLYKSKRAFEHSVKLEQRTKQELMVQRLRIGSTNLVLYRTVNALHFCCWYFKHLANKFQETFYMKNYCLSKFFVFGTVFWDIASLEQSIYWSSFSIYYSLLCELWIQTNLIRPKHRTFWSSCSYSLLEGRKWHSNIDSIHKYM